MKKLLIAALALVMAVSMLAVPVSANPGPPTIDGVVDPTDEWDGATVIDVANQMGTVSVLAYTDYLYVLFDVQDSTDARLGENLKGNDQVGLNINPTDGVGLWGKPCDIVFQTGADPAAFTTPDPNPDDSSSGVTDDWETEWCIVGSQLPLPTDVETMTLYSATTRVSEWKIPLATIAPSQGDMLKVGGAIDVGDGSSYVYPVGLDWSVEATYVDVPVQPTSVTVTVNMEPTVSISVDPTLWDFGTIVPGVNSATIWVTVTNTGTVPIKVTTELDPTGTVFDTCLHLPSGSLIEDFDQNLVGGAYWANDAQLQVPRDYPAKGIETATVIFWATPLP